MPKHETVSKLSSSEFRRLVSVLNSGRESECEVARTINRSSPMMIKKGQKHCWKRLKGKEINYPRCLITLFCAKIPF